MSERERQIEALAEYAHDAWSGWMRYLFSKCEVRVLENVDRASLVIPERFVDRWRRQLETRYADLPEEEKESDRVEAQRMLEVLERATSPDYPSAQAAQEIEEGKS